MSHHLDAALAAIDALLDEPGQTAGDTSYPTVRGTRAEKCWRCTAAEPVTDTGLCQDCSDWLTETSDHEPATPETPGDGPPISGDHGVLDLGIQRASDDDRQNDLAMFAERWHEIAQLPWPSGNVLVPSGTYGARWADMNGAYHFETQVGENMWQLITRVMWMIMDRDGGDGGERGRECALTQALYETATRLAENETPPYEGLSAICQIVNEGGDAAGIAVSFEQDPFSAEGKRVRFTFAPWSAVEALQRVRMAEAQSRLVTSGLMWTAPASGVLGFQFARLDENGYPVAVSPVMDDLRSMPHAYSRWHGEAGQRCICEQHQGSIVGGVHQDPEFWWDEACPVHLCDPNED